MIRPPVCCETEMLLRTQAENTSDSDVGEEYWLCFSCGNTLEYAAADISKRRQQEVLQALDHLIRERGYSPTLKDIGARLGLSTNCVRYHLQRLRDTDQVKWEPGLTRTLRIVQRSNINEKRTK